LKHSALFRSRSFRELRCSHRQLNCEDGTEPGFALYNAFIRLRSLGQRVRLDDRFNFALRYEIKGFVEIFGAVLLATDHTNALRDEVPIINSFPYALLAAEILFCCLNRNSDSTKWIRPLA
jgi:hypothetical protein